MHNISNVCYAKETESSHIIAIQSGHSFTNNEYFEVHLITVKTKVSFSSKIEFYLKIIFFTQTLKA